MNLFLLWNDRTVEKVLTCPSYMKGRDIILCFNYLVFLRLEKEGEGHVFKFIEELLTPDDYKSLHSATDRFAMEWYKINGIDQTLFKGVSFGAIVQVMFSRIYRVSLLIKQAELVHKVLLGTSNVGTIYFDYKGIQNEYDGEFSFQDLIKKQAKQFGALLVFLGAEKFIPDSIFTFRKNYDHQRLSISRKAKMLLRKVIKNLINAFSFFKNIFSMKHLRKNVYFFNYPNLNALLECDEQHFVIPELSAHEFKPRILFTGVTFLDFESIEYQLNAQEVNFLDYLKEKFGSIEKSVYGCDFSIRNVDYSDLYRPIIRDMVSNIIPALLKYYGKVTTGIKKFKINSVIMRDCLDEKSRVVLEACKHEKVKTVFIDHGIMGHLPAQKTAELSLPDKLITAGSFNPYKEMNALSLGNPCMDLYPSEKRKRITSIKKVLFLSFEDNFYARLDRLSYQEKYYNEIFSCFKELKLAGIDVFYRPHMANQDYHDYQLNFFEVDPSMFKYAFEGTFSERIYEMDLLVTNISTCFFEAQAAGVPAVFMEPNYLKGTTLHPFDGINGKEVLRVTNKKELLELILSNQHDPAYLNNFLDQFLNQYAPVYMGDLDGMASKRIINYICPKDES